MEQLLKKNENENNELVSNIFLWIEVFVLIIWTLRLCGVFNVDFVVISVFTIGASILLIVPIICIRILRISSSCMKYFLILDMAIITGSGYYFFSYQMIIMFVFPVLIALLYMDRRVLMFAQISSIVVLIIVHIMSRFFCAQPWIRMFINIGDIVRLEIIPRVIQLCVCFVIIDILIKRLIDYFSQYDKIIHKEKSSDICTNEDSGEELDEFKNIIKCLTDSEEKVFFEMLRGKTNNQIAQTLSLSNGTVKNYVSRVYDKLECRERNYLILKYGVALKMYESYDRNSI